mgnify:CR=1 FL=1
MKPIGKFNSSFKPKIVFDYLALEKAKYLVLGYGIYEVWSELNRMPGDNVAHLAHLGGMLIGYIILRYWKNKNGTYY